MTALTDQDRIEMSADNCGYSAHDMATAKASGFREAENIAADRIAEQAREIERLMETFAKVADFLGIDTEAARKAPGKPSYVFIAAIKAQPSGVVLPEQLITTDQVQAMLLEVGLHGDVDYSHAQDIWNACADRFARLNSSPVSARDAEQASFKEWISRVTPSGDVDSVHAQWLESSDYEDFCDQAYDAQAEHLTAEALGVGTGINPDATSVDDIFLTESAGGDEVALRTAVAQAVEYLDVSGMESICSGSVMHQRLKAALSSAPNHSEQVRDEWASGFKLHEIYKALDELRLLLAKSEGGEVMRKPLKWMHGSLNVHRLGRLMYSNFAMRVDFRYGGGIARHLFWQFWWVTGDKP